MATSPHDSYAQGGPMRFSASLEKRSRGVAILKVEGKVAAHTSRVIEAAAEKSKQAGVTELIAVLNIQGAFEANLLEDLIHAQQLMQVRGGNLRVVAKEPELFNILRMVWVKGRGLVYPELTSALTEALISLEAGEEGTSLELVPYGSGMAIRPKRRSTASHPVIP